MLFAATTSQKVNVVVAVLAALGFAVLAASIWFWRATRPDPEALGPLEVMSDGSWRDANFTDRRNRLEAARPETSEVAASYAASRVNREGLSELAARHEGEQPAFAENAGFGDLLDARIVEHSPMSPAQVSAAADAAADVAAHREVEAAAKAAVAEAGALSDGIDVDGTADDGIPRVPGDPLTVVRDE